MIIYTENSTYEVDLGNKRFRRLIGTASARLTDGEWVPYEGAYIPEEPGGIFRAIFEHPEKPGKYRYLTTSPVIRLERP